MKFFVCAVAMLGLAGCVTTSTPVATVPLSNLGASIRQLGFTDVLLPSTGYGPGSLVTSLRGSGGLQSPLQLAYLCRPDFTNAPAPIIDVAASGGAASAFSGSLNLDLSILDRFGLGAKAEDVESVKLTITNVRIEQLPLDDLAAIVSGLRPDCTRRLAEYRSRRLAFQTVQALRADVEYSVSFKASASATVRATITERLKASLGGQVGSSSEGSVSGKGLYFGLVIQQIR